MKQVIITETEERIKQAAKQVFLRRGFDGARMQDIADEAQVDKALVHYYYRSKDKLFTLVFDEMAGHFLNQIEGILSAPVPFAEKIRLLIQQDTTLPDEFPTVAQFIITELNQSQHRTDQALALPSLHEVRRLFVEQVNREIEAGTIRPIEPLHLFITLISLSLFPLVAQPLLRMIVGMNEREYKDMLTERVSILSDFLAQSIKP